MDALAAVGDRELRETLRFVRASAAPVTADEMLEADEGHVADRAATGSEIGRAHV